MALDHILIATLYHLYGVSAIEQVHLGAAASQAATVHSVGRPRALAIHSTKAEGIAVAGKALGIEEKARAILTTGVAACVVFKKSPCITLRLIGSDFVIGGAGLRARLHHNAQLGRIGGVKEQQILIQLLHIGNLPPGQMQTIGNIFCFGIFIAADRSSARSALHQKQFHSALGNSLRRQKSTTGYIALLVIQSIDFLYDVINIAELHLLSLIGFDNSVQLSIGQNSGRVGNDFFQLKGNGLALGSLGGFFRFHLILRSLPVLSDLAFYALSFQIIAHTIHLNARITLDRIRNISLRRCSKNSAACSKASQGN